MRKAIVFQLLFVVLLTNCAPSKEVIQTAFAQTQAAIPSATFTPTQTPVPTSTHLPWWNNCLIGTQITSSQYDQILFKQVCIYGVITQKQELKEGGFLINIFPNIKGTIVTFLIVARNDAYLATNMNLHNFNDPILASLSVGDCIIAYGTPVRSSGDLPGFVAILETDSVRFAQQATGPSVQTIISTCK